METRGNLRYKWNHQNKGYKWNLFEKAFIYKVKVKRDHIYQIKVSHLRHRDTVVF
uniref:Uncharacterized protein n=1 Tax=Picea glauca TaxID=3330 RepID=A0A101M5B4_PICGL|nr:hypothetical protein ABT39_MTgene993 [Picea glauca]